MKSKWKNGVRTIMIKKIETKHNIHSIQHQVNKNQQKQGIWFADEITK